MLQRLDAPPTERDLLEDARRVLHVEALALQRCGDQLGESFLTAQSMIHQCTDCVLVTGMGKAGLIGRKLSATLASTGTRSHFVHPSEAVHGDLGKIGGKDVVVALSHSGETLEIVQLLPFLREVGAGLIAVTSRPGSRLAKSAHCVVGYGPVEEACPMGLAPSTSCAVMLAIGDALAFGVMRLRGFADVDFGKVHPAGTLGRRLQAVDDLMRTGDQLRIASADLTVSQAFVAVQRPGRRTGAIILVDPEGKLEGLFTDSDLARLLERQDVEALGQPIRLHMARRPTMLRIGQRVVDALDLLRDRHISEIPVVNADDVPVGIVDITDVIDLLPNRDE